MVDVVVTYRGHTKTYAVSATPQSPPLYVPSDATSLYTSVLAAVTVVAVGTSLRISSLDRKVRKRDRDDDTAQRRRSALATAAAIIDTVADRIEVVIAKDMAIDNKMPLGAEASLSAFAVRLLQPDIAECFGNSYEAIAQAALQLETWSHALQQFRERALDTQRRSLEKAENESDVIRFMTVRLNRPPTPQEVHADLPRYRRDFAAELTLGALQKDIETFSADLARVRTAIDAAKATVVAVRQEILAEPKSRRLWPWRRRS